MSPLRPEPSQFDLRYPHWLLDCLNCRDNYNEGGELVRGSLRLKQPPPKLGRTSHKRRKKRNDALCKESKETIRSVNSSSEEWHNEEEKMESTDIENNDERGYGDDEVLPIIVRKPHEGKQNSQVSVTFFSGDCYNFKWGLHFSSKEHQP